MKEEIKSVDIELSKYVYVKPKAENEKNEGTITFYCGNVEYIKMTSDGFFVKGEKVEDKHDLYNAFWNFLVDSGYTDTRKNI